LISSVSLSDFEMDSFTLTVQPSIPQSEIHSLYHLAGYCVFSLAKTCVLCEDCVNSVASDGASTYDHLLSMREFKPGCLFRISDAVMENLFLKIESLFRSCSQLLADHKAAPLYQILIDKASTVVSDFKLPDCHSIKEKIISKFIRVRLHFFARRQTALLPKVGKASQKGSKTMYSYAAADEAL
jgi:hypothetical protein